MYVFACVCDAPCVCGWVCGMSGHHCPPVWLMLSPKLLPPVPPGLQGGGPQARVVPESGEASEAGASQTLG